LARHQYLDAITEHLTQGVFHALQVILAPALGIIVVVMGAFEVPVAYAIAASALTFAAAAMGLLRFSEWMQGIRIDDRLCQGNLFKRGVHVRMVVPHWGLDGKIDGRAAQQDVIDTGRVNVLS
jgi:hypothetical protein